MNRLGVIALAALTLAGCGRSEATTTADASEPSRLTEAAEGRSLTGLFAETPETSGTDSDVGEFAIDGGACTDEPERRPVPPGWRVERTAKPGAGEVEMRVPHDWQTGSTAWEDSSAPPAAMVVTEWVELPGSIADHDVAFGMLMDQFGSISSAERLDWDTCLFQVARDGVEIIAFSRLSESGLLTLVTAVMMPDSSPEEYDTVLTILASVKVTPVA